MAFATVLQSGDALRHAVSNHPAGGIAELLRVFPGWFQSLGAAVRLVREVAMLAMSLPQLDGDTKRKLLGLGEEVARSAGRATGVRSADSFSMDSASLGVSLPACL